LTKRRKNQRRAEKEARAKAKADREKYKQIGGKRWAKIYDPDPEGKALENVSNWKDVQVMTTTVLLTHLTGEESFGQGAQVRETIGRTVTSKG